MKKSQMAMEFLMTYGWAILVVLVAIGSLWYFGILTPEKFLPNNETKNITNNIGEIAGDGEVEVYNEYFRDCINVSGCTQYHLVMYKVT